MLRRSISELCFKDHKGDRSHLDQWLANKTSENVRVWIETSGQVVLVAEEEGRITGVGAATDKGEILLNYVSPDARFNGVSTALMAHLESYVLSQGNRKSYLSTTLTAHRFYIGIGYKDDPDVRVGTGTRAMVKLF